MLLALFGGTRTMAGGCWTLSTGPAATVRATIARLRKQLQGRAPRMGKGTVASSIGGGVINFSRGHVTYRDSFFGVISME